MNPSYSDRMQPVIQRFDASRDWKTAEVVSLFDDIAAVHDLPFRLGGRGLSKSWEGDDYAFKTGAPLPPELADSPWGPPQPSGLRLAWRLEPFAREVRVGTLLESRVLFHNSGDHVLVFPAPEWIQGGMEIRDAKGEPIECEHQEWTRIGMLTPFRLAPGDFAEVVGAKIVIGRREEYGDGDRRFNYVGSWIDARSGDEVTLTPGPVPAKVHQEPDQVDGTPGWWPKWIAERLSRELPLPVSAEERMRILDRVTDYLFGTAPTAEEIAAFVEDRSPDALESLQQRLMPSRPKGVRRRAAIRLDDVPRSARRPRRSKTTTRNQPPRQISTRQRHVVRSRPPGRRKAIDQRSWNSIRTDERRRCR